MQKEQKRITEKVEFVINNWDKPTKELQDILEVSPYTISKWVIKLRKKGINLKRKMTTKKANIDWDYLQKKYKNQSNKQ